MKILEYIEDAYYYLVWQYRDVKFWCRHNLTKAHFNVVKAAWLGYPFDYSYIYKLEKAKLEELYEYFSKANYISKEQYDEYCSKIRLAINLLDIIIEDDAQPENDVYVNHRNWKRFMPWYSDSNVQNKNPEEWCQYMFKTFPGILRTHKARYLYYKVRLQYGETWCD